MWKYIIGGALAVVLVLVALPAAIRAYARANEAQAILDTRTVIDSEQKYAAANCGFFAPLTSLTRADDGEIGIPGYLDTAPAFLSDELAREVPYTKDGYVRDWIGYPEPENLDTTRCDEESVLDYCYGAVPSGVFTGGMSYLGVAAGSIVSDGSGRDMCPLNDYGPD